MLRNELNKTFELNNSNQNIRLYITLLHNKMQVSHNTIHVFAHCFDPLVLIGFRKKNYTIYILAELAQFY